MQSKTPILDALFNETPIVDTTLKSITDVTYGIIVHQVNCQNKMGAGVARTIYEKHPRVKEDYHKYCSDFKNPKALLGELCYTVLGENLCVISIFSQEFYGNSKTTGKCYTNQDLLIARIIYICEKHAKMPVYIPEYIGCGLAGGNWDYVRSELRKANLPNLGIVSLKK